MFEDNKEMPLGEKREKLYKMAVGEYSWQLDSDDNISPDDGHIDRLVTASHDRFKFMLPDMFVCEQNDTQSDNFMGRLNLKERLKGRNIFGG